MATPSPHKREILNAKTVLYEHSNTATPPSKDYVNVVVNDKGVILRTWYINPQSGIHHYSVSDSAHEDVCTLDEFVHHSHFNEDISRSAGPAVLQDALAAAKKALH